MKTHITDTASRFQVRYRVTGLLGKGGHGTVYKAEDHARGGCQVAVKQVSLAGLNAQRAGQAFERYRREVSLLASLSHPALPRVHDHFVIHDQLFLVMDYIEGETLLDYQRRFAGGRLPIGEVLCIGLALCNILLYLHTRALPVIFRDLKPENILRAPDGRIYLVDFGIARLFKQGQGQDTQVLGTPGFSPPEQYGTGQTTPRSDIFALGVTLYSLLTGAAPREAPFNLASLGWQWHPWLARLDFLLARMVHPIEGMRPSSIAAVQQEIEGLALSLFPVPVGVISPLAFALCSRSASGLRLVRTNYRRWEQALRVTSVVLARRSTGLVERLAEKSLLACVKTLIFIGMAALCVLLGSFLPMLVR